MMLQNSIQPKCKQGRFSPQKYWLRSLIERPLRLCWYSHWRSSLNSDYKPLSDHWPWITFDAIDWLKSYISPEMSVFEWGSGSSTLFWSDFVHSVVTIEHDPEWYKVVAETLTGSQRTNVTLRLIEPKQPGHWNNSFASTDDRYQGLSFESYVRAIEKFEDGSFDLVVVDGRARVDCITFAKSKVRKGGCVILDNSDRQEYADAFKAMADWPRKDFLGVVASQPNIICATSIWRRADGDLNDL